MLQIGVFQASVNGRCGHSGQLAIASDAVGRGLRVTHENIGFSDVYQYGFILNQA